jgi:hypothetical protein
MSRDVVALVPVMPDVRDIVAGMLAAGPELGVRPVERGPVVQLCDQDGRPLVSIELPVLVRVPGEVERLLGPGLGEGDGAVQVPVWWVEARAPSARAGAEALARRFAETVAERLGGLVWPPAEPDPSGPP